MTLPPGPQAVQASATPPQHQSPRCLLLMPSSPRTQSRYSGGLLLGACDRMKSVPVQSGSFAAYRACQVCLPSSPSPGHFPSLCLFSRPSVGEH